MMRLLQGILKYDFGEKVVVAECATTFLSRRFMRLRAANPKRSQRSVDTWMQEDRPTD